MLSYIYSAIIFFGIPVGITVYFMVSLVRYIYAKRANRSGEKVFLQDEIKRRRFHIWVSLGLMVVLVLIVGGIMALLYMALSYM